MQTKASRRRCPGDSDPVNIEPVKGWRLQWNEPSGKFVSDHMHGDDTREKWLVLACRMDNVLQRRAEMQSVA